MSDWRSAPNTVKIRKTQNCDWCWEHMRVGEECVSYGWSSDGDMGREWLHPECDAARNRYFSAFPGEPYTPGNNARGKWEYDD